jgi:hopanoid biosynthesis associated radical SAM protein HpnH
MWTVATYLLRQKLRGTPRYPLVLMLEPLFRCNLACGGCGKIQYPKQVLKSQLSVEECMRAVDECGAPMVSIPGGEPLLHPQIDRIVEGLVARKKYIYLCTNALLLEQKLDLFTPSRYLSFSVHLDGDRETHDAAVCRDGVYEKAVSAIRAALDRGFRVTTNTTLFDGADPERTARFFDAAMELGVEGMMVSPGYSYAKAPDQEHFLPRERTRRFFQRVLDRPGSRRWRFNQSPLFLEFLDGARDLECTPWAMPSYSVFGWQKPCYLLQEGYAASYRELLEDTRWERYGHASGNPACRDCMVHSGFEASAVEEAFSGPRGLWDMLRALLLGPRVPAARDGDGHAAVAREREPGLAAQSEPAAAPTTPTTPSTGWASPGSPEALRTAFDFRGEATLTLADGSHVAGYVMDPGPGSVRVWTRDGRAAVSLDAAKVTRVELTGRDPAAG